ncbi:MAG TPA: multicopper oxidase domain-containing protein, partial [Gemmatimonadales bacterium]|nr:multicopper oxidase domain-containing protein [Gemmatimonadales bacterium]
MNRRDFLATSGLAIAGLGTDGARWPRLAQLVGSCGAPRPADVMLRIAPVTLELAPQQVVHTIGYNGTSPGPLLRLREGVETTIEVQNGLEYPEIVHWHGQLIPSEVDGASEEGTPPVAAHGRRRYRFTPRPAGTRWYHTHARAGAHPDRSLYTGQFGFFYVEPAHEPGQFDREVFLALREWAPSFTNKSEEEEEAGAGPGAGAKQESDPKDDNGKPNGLEVSYRYFSINDRALGHGEPIRVKAGERVMLRLLNASATESRTLALPGHQFTVLALDGNPVPTPRAVETLDLAPAERVDAVVEMNQPGIWILGVTHDADRTHGMGVVVEYAGQRGQPVWRKPGNARWDYTAFGKAGAVPKAPDEQVELVFRKIKGGKGGFNRWLINGKAYPDHPGTIMPPAHAPQIDPIRVHPGGRYRLIFRNQSDDAHPIHLHRHLFELVEVAGRPAAAGVLKDTVLVPGFGRVAVDFVADQPGPSLFHCHQQLHQDFGFMTL